MSSWRTSVEQNPFYVLGVPLEAPRPVIEREGAKLLGLLTLEVASARHYLTPLGPRARDADLVRWALAELRDPDKRLQYELWAQLPAAPVPADEPDPATAPWPEARRVLGWWGK